MTAPPLRLLLVDDHAASREPLAELLNRQPDMVVVGQARSLAEAQALLNEGIIAEVALIDLDLGDGNGTELIRDLRLRDPDAITLVLTASRDRTEYARAVANGCAGVIHKSASVRQIIDAIRLLAAGESLMTQEEVAELVRLWTTRRDEDEAARAALTNLTPREQEILQSLAEGLGNEAISGRLSISPETVRVHVRNLLAKLGVASRLAAVVLAYRYGAVRPR
jgi:DNA-binding NarL/FixJ family response regulator